jgi:diguanylate cyclase (GGDEF)-like protein
VQINKDRISFRWLTSIALGLIAVSALAIGLTIWGLRSDAIDEANSNTSNIATILGEQFAQSIRSVELVLSNTRNIAALSDGSVMGDFAQRIRSHEVHAQLKGLISPIPQASFIALIDKDGRIASTSQQWPAPTMEVGDRDYFIHSKGSDDDATYISGLLRSRTTGERAIFISRRISDRNNAFLGVVVIGLPLSYFERIYNSIKPLREESFMLLHSDGTIIVRYPDASDRSNQKMPAGSPWYSLVAVGGGHYRSPGYFDEQPRLVSVRTLSDYPLVVNVAMSESSALATWYHRAALIGIGGVLALMSSIFLLNKLAGQFHRLLRSETVLAERESGLAEKTLELQRANLKLDAALNNMSQGLCMFGNDGRLLICNERYLRMYNLSADVVRPGVTLLEMLRHRKEQKSFADDPVEYDRNIRAAVRDRKKINIITELQDSRVIEVVNQPIANGGWVATHEEITERKRAEAEIAHLALHDTLTGLSNRAAFNEEFAATISVATNSGESFALICVDLDRFKYVNDLFGHAVGDALLCEVGKRLKLAAGTTFVARVGGDEFVLLVTGPDAIEKSSRVVERIISALGDYIVLDGHRLTANASVGVAIYPDDATDSEQLICNADAALYRAKAEGAGSYRFFEPEMDRHLRERREIQHDLAAALENGEFELVYQPEALIDGTIIGFEALIRWHHPNRGLVPPSTFIPLAEDGGLIIPLGEWILRTACREAASWNSRAVLAVNLSPAQFRHSDLSMFVHTVLIETGLPASRLELEITESVLIDDFSCAQAILRRLKSLGVKIVMDDFGTGYSSLSYLHSFPFDKLKIDRSFVSDLETNNNSAAVVRAVITLAKSLQVPVLAEGVETEGQRLLLKSEGCNQIQGYLLGKPEHISNYNDIVNLVSIDTEDCVDGEAEPEASLLASYSTKRPDPRHKSIRS